MLRRRVFALLGLSISCGLWPATAGCTPVATVTVSEAGRTAGAMRVAVLDFAWDPAGQRKGPGVVRTRDAGAFVADCVAGRIGELPGVTVLPRATVKRVDLEQRVAGRTLAGMVQAGQEAEVGRLLGADALVVGTVDRAEVWVDWTQQGETVAFHCRCVAARDGQTLWTLAGERVVGPNVTGPIDPTATIDQILDDGIRKLRQGLGGGG